MLNLLCENGVVESKEWTGIVSRVAVSLCVPLAFQPLPESGVFAAQPVQELKITVPHRNLGNS
jgi:hypothetical protein